MENNLFEWLVQYHCQRNLEACLPHIVDGIVRPNKREGFDENEWYNGLLIVSDGSALIKKLLEARPIDRVALDDKIEDFTPTRDKNAFFEYLEEQEESEGGDGAFVYDSTNQRITRVCELNNNPKRLEENGIKLDDETLSRILPGDFVFYNGGGVAKRYMIRTKTRLAAKFPMAHDNAETFQIKRTRYTPLGMGKVTHFNKDGLAEEFFLMHSPNSDGPFINQENSIVGVYRSYLPENRRVVRVSERIVDRGLLES